MKKIKQIATIFNELLERLSALFLLNMLFLLTALPIFSAGAAIAALNEICIELLQEGRFPSLYRRYWHSFKRHFKQGSCIWLFFLVCVYDMYLITYYFGGLRLLLHPFPCLILFMAALILLFTRIWVFPLIATSRSAIRTSLKTAFSLSFVTYSKTLVCLMQSLIILILTLLCPVLLLVSFSTTTYLHCRTLQFVLRKYEHEGFAAAIN